MFRPFFHKLKKGFSVSAAASRLLTVNDDEFDEEMDTATAGVEEGYFTVFTVHENETKRFVIELDNLRNPAFLCLLEQAQEEYGFEQKGALSLPCRPQELQKILNDRKAKLAVTEVLGYL
ncbi:Auxin responsive SAUR protein [Corchorus capsularis]|uniref:Auxin responsive SAUR protein n=1 Tax=Corchorus capsularis TaxID=210143 RepID=A0A1R3HQB8_COCAP|nr:Auxin responsive SAUR protein [Corchorus capsularis]